MVDKLLSMGTFSVVDVTSTRRGSVASVRSDAVATVGTTLHHVDGRQWHVRGLGMGLGRAVEPDVQVLQLQPGDPLAAPVRPGDVLIAA